MKYVILISGRMRVGKNQFAEYLIENFKNKNLTIETDLFAKSLKDGCKKDFKTVVNYLDYFAEELKKATRYLSSISTPNELCANEYEVSLFQLNKTIDELKMKDENFYENKTELTRLFLQLYGTEIFRNRVDKDWWAKQVRNRAIETKANVTVITDTRFPNEIEVFYDKVIYSKDIKVITVRIERSLNTDDDKHSHESETALDSWNAWDYIVENNETLEDLKDSSNTIINDIMTNIDTSFEQFM